VNPFSHSFVPSESGNVVQYTVTNGFAHPVAFEVRVYKRKQDKKGNDVLEPVDPKKIVIMPRHLILGPYAKRNFKLKYKGRDPLIEESYRVMITHHDINFDKEEEKKVSGIKFKLQAGASLHVTPAGAKPVIEVVSVISSSVSGKLVFSINVRNRGNKRAKIKELRNPVKIFGDTYELCDVLKKEDKEGVILAGAERIFEASDPTAKKEDEASDKKKK
jgi:hypothetical protein